MKRNWQPGTDVRGPFLYMDVSDTVRVAKRQSIRDGIAWEYEIQAFDAFSAQYAPYRVPGVLNAETAIANAKALARGLGEPTKAVR